uniref:Secreted protein n=1 Tax=Macrostomum lignano TaxID=282301 RepID=A0A1I8FRB8_9PLAT
QIWQLRCSSDFLFAGSATCDSEKIDDFLSDHFLQADSAAKMQQRSLFAWSASLAASMQHCFSVCLVSDFWHEKLDDFPLTKSCSRFGSVRCSSDLCLLGQGLVTTEKLDDFPLTISCSRFGSVDGSSDLCLLGSAASTQQRSLFAWSSDL